MVVASSTIAAAAAPSSRFAARSRAGAKGSSRASKPAVRPVRPRRFPSTRASSAEAAPEAAATPVHLVLPTQLFDTDFVGSERKYDARLEEVKKAIAAWSESVESGACDTVTAEATEAAEWIRQALTLKIELGEKNLSNLQSKIVSEPEMLQNLLLMGELESVHAMYALQVLCYRNGAVCWKLANLGLVEVVRTHIKESPHEQVKCAAAFCVGAVVAFNEDTHRLIAKGRLVPALVDCLRESCDETSCELNFKDFRDKDVCDHAAALLRNLSHNSAQHKLLKASGCVEVLLNILGKREGAVRINSACTIANLVGREEADSRLEEDPTIIEEVLEVLEAALDGKKIGGLNYTVWKMVQGIANLATIDANKQRIVDAGALPMLVRCLNERQHAWDKAVFWSAGALWNLAFDEAIRERILAEPGATDALEEARRLGSENTKMKARGALWMIKGQSEEGTTHVLSESDLAKLGEGAVEGAKAQVMLSYEWRTQQQVMILKEELMEAGFTVWMDVDRMMGSTLEAMAAAIEQSDAIIMCVTHRYKESQACRTEAEYAYTRKKPLIPVMFEKSYKPDGWLGIIMGSKLYYNAFNSDEIRDAMPGLVGEISAAQGENSTKPAFLKGDDGGGGGGGASAAPAPAQQSMREETKVTVPQDMDTLTMWLEGRGLQRYKSAFEEQHLYGKALIKLHEEIGFGDPANAGYHELFREVLGITSYGHRLLLLAELEELIGPVKWRRR